MPIERIRIEQKPSAPRADGFAVIVFCEFFKLVFTHLASWQSASLKCCRFCDKR